jgi:hypothetical protein
MAAAPVASGAIPSKTRVFISYSRKDMAFADMLEQPSRSVALMF